MTNRILITFGALIFGLLVPMIEIDATHVFNPEWPPHARLHEVWQLMTNSMLALLCLWLVWRHDAIRMAAAIGATVTGGFLAAYAIRSGYDGSMALGADGIERSLGGYNLGVVVFSVVFAVFLLAFVRSGKRRGSHA